jgi:hypothetical protein
VNRRVLAALGVVVAVAGFALLLLPDLSASLTTGRSVLYAVAGLSFLYAIAVADDRSDAEIEGHEAGEPETVQSLPAPGIEFRERMERVRRQSSFESQRLHQSVTEELEVIAVGVLTRREGCSEREARRLLERGNWTTDPVAAEFFTTRGLRMTTADLFREVAGRRTPYSEKVDRVVDELVRQWQSAGGSSTDSAGGATGTGAEGATATDRRGGAGP